MTDDQAALLRDKYVLWERASREGPMDLRDYNRRAAEALKAALMIVSDHLTARAEESSGQASICRVELEPDGQLDDLAITGDRIEMLRLEAMDGQWMWGQVYLRDGSSLRISFGAEKRNKLSVLAEWDAPPDPTIPAPAEARSEQPVAWRVKDFADGWILHHSRAAAEAEARDTGALIQPLYARGA